MKDVKVKERYEDGQTAEMPVQPINVITGFIRQTSNLKGAWTVRVRPRGRKRQFMHSDVCMHV